MGHHSLLWQCHKQLYFQLTSYIKARSCRKPTAKIIVYREGMIKGKNQELHMPPSPLALSQQDILIMFHRWDLEMKLLTWCKSKVYKQVSVTAGKEVQLLFKGY